MGVRGARGVTLIELMVTAMLLVIALTGLAASFPFAMQAVTGGGYQTASTLLAQQCIELAKSMPYSRLAIDLVPNCPANAPGFDSYTRTVTVTTASPTDTTTTVTVQVTYTSVQGQVQTSLTTMLAE